MLRQFDLLVVGGGPAGYSAAIRAARSFKRHGATVGLVEARELGGTCLNRGCIPTKTLIETADFLTRFAEAPSRGIALTGTAAVDIAKTFQYKNRIVKRMSAGIGVLLRENGVEHITGSASIRRNGAAFLAAVEKDGSHDEIAAKKIILATGSVPSIVPVSGIGAPGLLERVVTSDDILDGNFPWHELPEKLAILGGGVIGLEMARIFRAFGSGVHLIEALPRLVPFLDVDISEALTRSFRSQKIEISVGRKLERIGLSGSELTLFLDDGRNIAASHLMIAVGRSPKTDMLSEELLAELKPDRRGFLPVGRRMNTAVGGLFAPGDVNGKCMLAHAAIEMGRLAAEAVVDEMFPQVDPAENERDKTDESLLEEYRRRIMVREDDDSPLPDPIRDFFPFHVPGCIYGDPEVGYIGWTEEQAREALGDAVHIGRFPFAANGRAASSGHRDGFVKVIRHDQSERIVGVHIVGPCATELINEVSAVMHLGGSVDQWAESVHAHPTYGEALAEAAADSLGLALDLPPK